MHPAWLLTFLQIILESLPISSSTHILFFSTNLALPFEVALDHAVHGITLIIIMLFWREKIIKIISSSWKNIFEYALFSLIGSIIPTVIFFSPLKQLTASISSFYGLIFTALILLLSQAASVSRKEISYPLALILGCAQSLALIPGISRMGITYSVGRYMNYSAENALWLSCLVEMPICGGGVLLALKEYNHILSFIDSSLLIALGITLSAIISYGALYGTYYLLTKNKTWIFSLYLLIVAFLAL